MWGKKIKFCLYTQEFYRTDAVSRVHILEGFNNLFKGFSRCPSVMFKMDFINIYVKLIFLIVILLKINFFLKDIIDTICLWAVVYYLNDYNNEEDSFSWFKPYIFFLISSIPHGNNFLTLQQILKLKFLWISSPSIHLWTQLN